ncbi:hypothetical protein D3C73_1373120 [compost metagenome]
MISSPGSISSSRAAISNAAVQECVSNALAQPLLLSSHSWQRLVKGPSPASLCPSLASVM